MNPEDPRIPSSEENTLRLIGLASRAPSVWECAVVARELRSTGGPATGLAAAGAGTGTIRQAATRCNDERSINMGNDGGEKKRGPEPESPVPDVDWKAVIQRALGKERPPKGGRKPPKSVKRKPGGK